LASIVTSDGPPSQFSRLIEQVERGEEEVITRSGKGMARAQTRPPRTFLDSNILLYCDDRADLPKQQRALEAVLKHKSQRTGVVSLQVLQEYFVNATRKLGLDTGLAREKVEAYSRFEVVEPAAGDILAAIDLHRLRGFSYWDSLILHCARQSGCRILLSEDMQHGQVVDGVRVVNPFL
jgi:predicted nucleic acid-binding protein